MTALKHNVAEIRWAGPGGKMEVVQFEAMDGFSTMSAIQVMLESETLITDFSPFMEASAKINVMVGEELTQPRAFGGVIIEMRQVRTGHGNWDPSSKKKYRYSLVIYPKLWLLSRVFRSRVYQRKSVRDIVDEIFGEHGVKADWRINRSPEPRLYCVQFKETNLNFVNRLLEDEGIYYFYDHEAEAIVLCDSPGAHKPCCPFEEIDYLEGTRHGHSRKKHEYINSLFYSEQVGTGKFETHDYNYETAAMRLFSRSANGTKPANTAYENYHHNANYAELAQGDVRATHFQEAEKARLCEMDGAGNARSLICGATFNLKKHYAEPLNDQYLITSTRILADQETYQVSFTAIPTKVTYRPQRQTLVPRVDGIQTAVVTGPSGEEVYLDDMGRCKLQFHWDREGKRDESSSMWVRVANNYAGNDYGVQFIPRIGHEVLVQFIDGNPDRPLVVGRVYNDLQAAPLGPEEKWHNIIKTPRDNHILFDDEMDKERFDVRAQKDMNTDVIRHKTKQVGVNETTKVGKNKTLSVGEIFEQRVDKEKHTEIKEDYTVKSDKGAIEMTADKKGLTFKSAASKVTIKPDHIELRMGGNFVRIDPSGITIRGTLVRIN